MGNLDLSDSAVRSGLPTRTSPHWKTLEFCRHLGLQKKPSGEEWWVARVRKKNGGYLQRRLGRVQKEAHPTGLGYSAALVEARNWFASDQVLEVASQPYPIGGNRQLRYDKKTDGFTVGDALRDYVEWKRLSASKTHFETNLSLINHHIIPRVGDVRVEDFTARHLTEFCRDVLETPPKRGKQPSGPRVGLENLDPEALRKRKKTVNTLIGIMRLAFRMAWENDEVVSDRAWRCLRRLPHFDTPRHHFLTRSQCARLIEVCRPDLRALVLGALYTGCRVSELSQMKVRDVGVHIFGVYVAPLKSYRGRYVFLPEAGMSFFLDLAEGRDEEANLFTMSSGKAWSGGHKHLFRDAVSEAELPEGFVFHGLRHTYASQLVQAGAPLSVVAKQLGHANTDTVSRTYGHLSCETIEDELARHFAPLEPSRADPRIAGLRSSLQGSEPERSSWPRHNFASSTSDIIPLLRGA